MSVIADGLTPKYLSKLADLVGAAVGRFLKANVAARLDGAEARLDALEALGLPSYAGTHEAGKAYGPNQLTTKGGGLWLSLRATNETPGAGATAWRLIVKKGEAAER